MNVVTTSEQSLMTAAEFVTRHGHESGVELANGRLVRLPMAGGRHGEVCGNVYDTLRDHVKPRKLGRVLINDTFVRTSPQTYRGADVLFIGYDRLPAEQPTPNAPLETPPQLVVEVKSPTDRRGDMLIKVGEYQNAGVDVVVVIDPDFAVATVYRGEELPQRFHNGDEFTLPDVLPGFAVPVARFFE